jgi:hypothetical protein
VREFKALLRAAGSFTISEPDSHCCLPYEQCTKEVCEQQPRLFLKFEIILLYFPVYLLFYVDVKLDLPPQ